jgi:hypothetical protein
MFPHERIDFPCKVKFLWVEEKEFREHPYEPWEEVAYFIHKYFTCEGHHNLLFGYHFKLLTHLCDIKGFLTYPITCCDLYIHGSQCPTYKKSCS